MTLSLKPEKRLPLILHILAWIIILVLPRYLVHTWGDGNMSFLHRYYMNTGFHGLFFYVNYLVLVPRLFFSEKRFWYFCTLVLSLAGLIIVLLFLNDALFIRPHEEVEVQSIMEGSGHINEDGNVIGPRHPPIRIIGMISHLTTVILLAGFSLGLGVLDRFRSNEKEKKEMEKEMLNAELALLKNQISPHFFFNTLNNIYSLIRFDTEKARETVHKLSKLMRYLLYDSDKSLTVLGDEIRFMQNYIELMQLRLNEKVILSVDLPAEPPHLLVPPLLFIPVVENAFKHGVSYREASFIEIVLKISGTEVTFRTRNSLSAGPPKEPSEHTGIGLGNVRKRLSLLLPGQHNLRIEPGRDEFLVEVTVNTEALIS
jgi:hypothetical protein